MLVAAGGKTSPNDVHSSTEFFLPGAASWTTGPDLPRALHAAGAANLDGKVFLTGGRDVDGIYHDEVTVYCPQNLHNLAFT